MKEENLLGMVGKEYLVSHSILGKDLESSTGLFFGIGLSNKETVTKDLPFDVIGMVLAGELVKRNLGLESATVLVADEHAKTNGFDPREIDKIALERRGELSKAVEKLGFVGWDVVLASEMSKEPLYAEVLSSVGTGNGYEKFQTANVEHFRRLGKGIKIGWMHEGMERDERRFDMLYSSAFGDRETFIYTKAGRALDGTPLPPYLHSPTRGRLFLKEGEDIKGKVKSMPRAVVKHYIKVLKCLSVLHGETFIERDTYAASDSLAAGLKQVYSSIFGYFGPQGSIIFYIKFILVYRKKPQFRLFIFQLVNVVGTFI
ncbi:MAG: hypothetical protein HY362_02950 [Candidatus Aenigmarchaeota archaeon]|nr:hypothetical protein [Candidatus Aenigmarchaeota archaeon]